MRRLRRVLKIVAIVALVVVLAAAVAIGLGLNHITRKAVEAAGSYALGVPTTLEKADISLWGGHVGFVGLRVADPQGFESPHFVQLRQVTVEVSVGSLLGDTVVVPKLELDGLVIALEKRHGQANYQVIMANLGKLESAGPQPAKPGKKFIIRKVVLTHVTAHVDLVPVLGKATSMDLPLERIELTDVGSESNRGVVAADLIGTLTKALLLAVANRAGNLPGEVVGDLGKGLGKLGSLASSGVGVVGDVGGKMGNWGTTAAQRISAGVGKVGQGVSEGVGRVGQGIGGLFRGEDSGNDKPDK
jgi:hypothetical protein